ncbi:HTH-type transcriptional regulator MalT [compost metagenome]
MLPDASTPSRSWLANLPRPPRHHLLRHSLLEQLLREDRRLTLLCAPAGSGKTTLMADCARQAGDVQIVWLRLHDLALDKAGFLTLLHDALGMAVERADEQQLIRLLLNRQEPLWLMLDDFPHEPDSPLDAALAQLLALPNRHIRWWVTARRRPSCNLSRLLMENELVELSSDQLFFRAEEVQALFANLSLDERDALRLHDETQGWCAAVSMALLDSAPHASNLLNEYLQRELLDGLPADLRQALRALSLVSRFDEHLCRCLCDTSTGQTRLADLLARGLFVQPAPAHPGWYRVPPIIARPLARQMPEEEAQHIHRLACQWLGAHGEQRLAIDHALALGLRQEAARLLEQLGYSQIMNVNQAFKVMEWSGDLPAELLHSTPDLVIVNALSLAMMLRAEEAHQSLDKLANFLPAATPDQHARLLVAAQAIGGLLAHAEGHTTLAREHCQQALVRLDDQDWVLKQTCWAVLARQQLFFGDLEAAEATIQAAFKSARPLGMVTAEALVDIYQSALLEARGELETASRIIERRCSQIEDTPYNATGIAGRLRLRLGQLLLRRGQPEQARRLLAESHRIALEFYDPIAFLSLVGLAQIALLNEELTKADDLLEQAEHIAQSRRVTEAVYRSVLDLSRAQLAIQRLEFQRAEDLLKTALARHSGPDAACQAFYNADMLSECERLLAGIDALKGRHALARDRLEQALAYAERLGLRAESCEVKLALAVNALLARKNDEALVWLQDGLSAAKAMELRLPVERLQRTRPELFALVADQSNSGLLSEREVEVLGLVAEGHSNQEIAEMLFISVFTVKSHIQRLSTKLEVKRRTQAVAKAKSLGLLG